MSSLMKTRLICGAICALLLAGCGPTKPKMLAAPVMGYNHTSAAINSFSVNGAGGPNLGPHQGGSGQTCCGVLPAQWRPGLTAVVEWEKDADPYSSSSWPEQRDSEAWHARMREEIKTWTHHRVEVEIPQYGQEFCSIKVHFLSCDQVQVNTTCLTPQHPDYPYKELFQLKENKECPTP
ncbi:DUF3304 domain-containing protein [Pseudomonas sp. J452]|uniref:DUF3304 domain-containing protein n=1 Tax=Pseudomonas sp. J452 TaxID=2898441 RepID=UPI0021AE2844|nr:DUF3304 domain-containing protein [Pseudomonas sp. J452]UUY09487.1 DUF3304 domain-containing protein [Pseudomonas sp. J452]